MRHTCRLKAKSQGDCRVHKLSVHCDDFQKLSGQTPHSSARELKHISARVWPRETSPGFAYIRAGPSPQIAKRCTIHRAVPVPKEYRMLATASKLCHPIARPSRRVKIVSSLASPVRVTAISHSVLSKHSQSGLMYTISSGRLSPCSGADIAVKGKPDSFLLDGRIRGMSEVSPHSHLSTHFLACCTAALNSLMSILGPNSL